MDNYLQLANIFPVVLIINCLQVPVIKTQQKEGIGDQFPEHQQQLFKLFNNLNCIRTGDKNLENISNTFNPLDNLNLYSNPELVKSYFENVSRGVYQSRTDPFTNDAKLVIQLVQLFDILFFVGDDWELFYKTAVYAMTRVNKTQFVWALGTLLSASKNFKGFRSPPYYEVLPQLFTPKWIVRKANGEDGKENAEDDNPENALKYFRLDPSINKFHMAWHVDFPFWWIPETYRVEKDRKGELFLYMHHQLMNRYKAERLSNKMSETFSLVLDKPIEEGNIPEILNVNYKEFPVRMANAILQDVPGTTVRDLQDWQDRIREGISQGYFLNNEGLQIPIRNDSGSDILGATIESSGQSADSNYYGSLHNLLHRAVAVISDPNDTLKMPPGILAHAETSIQDPVFYRIHHYVDDFNKAEKYKLSPYSQKDFRFPEVDISSVKISSKSTAERGRKAWPFQNLPVLKTFFEDFTYDISNAVKSCDQVNSGENFTATVRRLNHQPFEYKITTFSQKSGNTSGIVRIYMSPVLGYDGKPFPNEQLYWNMFEMDRFPVTLKQGLNEIRRASQNSSVTIPDQLQFRKLLKEANRGVSSDQEQFTRQCGYPHNLLVPKGTEEGMRFRMLVIITSTANSGDYDERAYPSLPFCGNPEGRFPDGKPMGFPFDRKVSFGFSIPWIIHENYKFLDLLVQHGS